MDLNACEMDLAPGMKCTHLPSEAVFVNSCFCAIIRLAVSEPEASAPASHILDMAEETDITLPEEEPRLCPSCGTRVAAMASSCLMCGASLDGEVEEPDLEEVQERRKLPAWARPLMVFVLSVVFLAVGLYAFYALMNVEPEVETPTSVPSATPSPTLTPSLTPTPRPTLTSTPLPPLTYQVQPGDTLSGIAAQYGLTVEDILALNPDVNPEALQVGYVLLIPSGTVTPTPTPTLDPSLPTPTQGDFVVHIVERGDTLGSIAEQYDVSVEAIRESNPDQLSADSDEIFVGQTLIIPLGTPVPGATATTDPRATATPMPLYPAPALLSPADGAVIAGTEFPLLLQWASVSMLAEDEWYEVTILYAEDVLHQFRTRATAWRVPFDLLLSVGEGTLEFRWQVTVVREGRDSQGELVYERASDAGEVRVFVWIQPTPTPTPTLDSTPAP
jgi:LysM repeat protein